MKVKSIANYLTINNISVMIGFSFAISILMTFSGQSAYATGYTLSDQASCEAAPFSGTWNAQTSTCVISHSFTLSSPSQMLISSGIILNNTATITVNSGATLTNEGIINIEGYGNISNLGTVTNIGTIMISGSNTYGIFNNGGTITNNSGGQIAVSGQSNGIYNNGAITNNSGAKITISISGSAVGDSGIESYGPIINDGTITISNTGTNSGIVISEGSTLTNNSGGHITISSNGYNGIYILDSGSALINNGTITISNYGGRGIDNLYGGAITNNSGGQITVSNTGGTDGIVIGSGSTFTNDGTITISNIYYSDGFNNGGTITNNSGGQITVSNSGGGNGIANTGTITNKSGGSIVNNAGSTIQNNGTIKNECGAIFTNNGTITGNAVILCVINTTTNISSSLNPSAFGQSVIFTATVSPTPDGGTVTFTVDGMPESPVSVSSGQATFTDSLSIGSHKITATYSGDTNYLASTSPTLTQTVNKISTTIILVSSTDATRVGDPVTFTATVSPPPNTGGTITSPYLVGVIGPPIPPPNTGGTVTFYDVTTSIGTGTINGSGIATFTTSSLAVGDHYITAVYPGNTEFTSSTSNVVNVKVVNLTPQEQIQDLKALIDGMNLQYGIANSMEAKLTAAINSLNSGQNTTAINQIHAFINEVNAQTGKSITQAQAAQLVLAAQNIINSIP